MPGEFEALRDRLRHSTSHGDLGRQDFTGGSLRLGLGATCQQGRTGAGEDCQPDSTGTVPLLRSSGVMGGDWGSSSRELAGNRPRPRGARRQLVAWMSDRESRHVPRVLLVCVRGQVIGRHTVLLSLVGRTPQRAFRAGKRTCGRWITPNREGRVGVVLAPGLPRPTPPG